MTPPCTFAQRVRIIQMHAAGYSLGHIAFATNVHKRTVHRWLSRWHKYGNLRLPQSSAPGRPSALSEGQLAELRRVHLEQNMSIRELMRYARDEMELHVSQTTLKRAVDPSFDPSERRTLSREERPPITRAERIARQLFMQPASSASSVRKQRAGPGYSKVTARISPKSMFGPKSHKLKMLSKVKGKRPVIKPRQTDASVRVLSDDDDDDDDDDGSCQMSSGYGGPPTMVVDPYRQTIDQDDPLADAAAEQTGALADSALKQVYADTPAQYYGEGGECEQCRVARDVCGWPACAFCYKWHKLQTRGRAVSEERVVDKDPFGAAAPLVDETAVLDETAPVDAADCAPADTVNGVHTMPMPHEQGVVVGQLV